MNDDLYVKEESSGDLRVECWTSLAELDPSCGEVLHLVRHKLQCEGVLLSHTHSLSLSFPFSLSLSPLSLSLSYTLTLPPSLTHDHSLSLSVAVQVTLTIQMCFISYCDISIILTMVSVIVLPGNCSPQYRTNGQSLDHIH